MKTFGPWRRSVVKDLAQLALAFAGTKPRPPTAARHAVTVLEDSSQAGFGGGQRISLEVMHALQDRFDIKLIDTVSSAWHDDNFRRYAPQTTRLHLDQLPSSSLKFDSLLIARSVRTFFRDPSPFLYVTTRKQALTALVLKALDPRVKIIHHVHLTPKPGLAFWLYDFLRFGVSHKVVLTSAYLAEVYTPSLMKLFGPRITVAPLPPPKWDPALRARYRAPQMLTIGYVGRLSASKGFDRFWEAVKHLDRDLPWRVVIAGDGELRARLVADLRASGSLRAKVDYRGTVDTTLAFYQQFSLVVVPSDPHIETIGLSALEAIQAGVPVLVTRKGNLANLQAQFAVDSIAACRTDALEAALNAYIRHERTPAAPLPAPNTGADWRSYLRRVFS